MRRRRAQPPERGQEDQTLVVGGLGTRGGTYNSRVRAVTFGGVPSDWTDTVQFELTDSVEGTASDPNLPGIPSNLTLIPMLNMILVKFDDEWAGDNILMSHNAGSYEIQISNATGGSPDWAANNEWTQAVGGDEAGDDSEAAKKYMVPDGKGFLCAGLKSESTNPAGGRTHYVRVRGINAHGYVDTVGDGWSDVEDVKLDLDNKAQTGTVISDGAIYTEHIGAATIRGTNIFGGTINATEMNANQIYATGIALPSNSSPSHAGDHGTIPYAFNIDRDGNVWWGNYATFLLAEAAAQKSYIKASTGDAVFLGNIATDTGGNSAQGGILATGSYGNARIVIGDNTTDLGVGGTAGGYGYLLGFTGHGSEALPGHAVFTPETTGLHTYGAAYFVAPRFHSGSGTDQFKYAGVRLRDAKITTDHRHEGTAQSGSSTTIVLQSNASTTSNIYNDHTIHITGGTGSGQNRTITSYAASNKTATVSPAWDTDPASGSTYTMSGLGEAILVHPADMDYMGIVSGPYPEGAAYGTYSEVMGVVTAPGGFRIKGHAIAPGTPGGLTLDPGTPATGHNTTGSSRNKLWNSSGTIMWGATDLTAGGSSYSWNLGLEEIEDGTTVAFGPEAQSGTTNLAWITQSEAFGVQTITVSAAKTITTRSDTGRNGLVIETASSPSTGVQLELETLSNVDVTSGTAQYIPWSTFAYGQNLQYRTDIEQLGVFIAGLSDFQEACDNRQLLLASGTNAAPAYSFADDSHTGIYRSDDNEISFTFSNSLRATMNLDGLSMVGGTAEDPGYHFLSDEDTGMFRPTNNVIGFSTAEEERMRITDVGVAIGYTADGGYKLRLGGTAWLNGYTYHASGGKAYPAFSPWSTYNGSYPADLGTTSLYWKNVYLQTHVYVSDVKVKSNVADATYGLDFVKQLRPVTYNMDGATGRSGARTHHGFIAQEIETLLGDAADGTALWTNSLSEAEPEMDGPDGSTAAATEEEWNQGLRYEQFIPILTKAIQELEARIAVLEG